MNKNTRYHMNRIERCWDRLTPAQRLYFVVKIYYIKYKGNLVVNAMTAGIIGGLLFDILVVSSSVSIAVGILVLFYSLYLEVLLASI